MKTNRSAPVLVLAVFLSAVGSTAQETRGMIFGRVTDPTSSVVADAAVSIVNTGTNTALHLRTNQTGYYEANLLLPGNYRVTAEAPGFKTFVRSGITLPMSSRLQINVQLELGALTEQISVSEKAPLLETTGVSSGRILDTRAIEDLPVARNNALLLIEFAPGTQSGTWRGPAHHAATIATAEMYAPGNVGGNEYLIDGVPDLGGGRRIAYMPHSDTLQEFKVETSNFDASIGHGTGLSVSMMTKAGTNQYHGTLSNMHWQQRWNAADFFVKKNYYRAIAEAESKGDRALADRLRSQPSQASAHSNIYSAVIGGPVILPKIWSGRDKLFFFFSLNGTNERAINTGVNQNRTVPTLANRQGDFSQLLQVDAVRYQLYDPLSVRPDPNRPTHYIRDPIPGNIVQPSRIINPAYKAYANFMPVPNNAPLDPRQEPTINYLAVAMPWNFDYYAYSNRIDYQHSNAHRFFGRWSWSNYYADMNDWTYESARKLQVDDVLRHNIGGTVDWVYAINSNTVVDTSLAANEYRGGNKYPVAVQFKPSDVGLPQYLDAKAGDQHILPLISFAGYESLGIEYPTQFRARTISLRSDLSHVRGNHTVRAGFDMRQYFRSQPAGGYPAGTFGFTNEYTRRNDDTNTPAGNLAHGWAAFMMGLPSTVRLETNDSHIVHTPAYAIYVQDNWRLTRKLSFTFGLRLEYEDGMTERYNRMIGYFEAATKLPISDAAEAAYRNNPPAERPASDFVVRGGPVYSGSGGTSRRLWRSEWMWLPRLAAAYQLNSATVLRAGYGIYFDTLNAMNFTPNQTGFSRPTTTQITNDFGLTWRVGDPAKGISPMSDPFPVRSDGSRFDLPVRDALGSMAVAGRSFSYNDPEYKHARQQRWRVGVQRQWGTNMVFEVAYAGAYSDRVPIGQTLRPLPEQYWASGLKRNDAIASDLNSNIKNPFLLANFSNLQQSNPAVYQDISGQGFFTSTTIRKNQLLRAFPNMSGLTLSNAPLGEARSNSLEVIFERRLSRGVTLNAAYTRLKASEADFFYNEFDALPSWQETNEGRPHRFVATSILELPLGKGRALLNRGILNHLFGGFQIGLTYQFQPGPLLNFGNLFYYGDPKDIRKGERTPDRWFNTDGFERVSTLAPGSFHRRVFPTRVDGVRGFTKNEWNGNVQREFRLHENWNLQVRLDALNLTNHSFFDSPNVSPSSTNFGKMTSTQATPNRCLQLQARIRF